LSITKEISITTNGILFDAINCIIDSTKSNDS